DGGRLAVRGVPAGGPEPAGRLPGVPPGAAGVHPLLRHGDVPAVAVLPVGLAAPGFGARRRPAAAAVAAVGEAADAADGDRAERRLSEGADRAVSAWACFFS